MMVTMSLEVFVIVITCPAIVAALATWFYMEEKDDER